MSTNDVIKSIKIALKGKYWAEIKNCPQGQVLSWNNEKFKYYAQQNFSNIEA